jgi:nitrilase
VSTVIRGTRINLAAAICWESYMPLLRQSLYNQNINLYLAPTADARDAWLSLMRSIGVEGRCFVVSSNMCVRGDGKGTAVPQEVNGAGAAAAVRDDGRRVSCSDEPTMDIALPKSGSPGRRRQRRKSVFDQDGNEIVLCCPADENGVPTTTMSAGKTTAAAASDSSAAAAVARTTGKTPWVCRGGSCIVDPFGEVLAGPQWEDDEGMIYADVDFQKCIQGRLDLDAGGSYSRNDVFKLTVEGLNMEPLPY